MTEKQVRDIVKSVIKSEMNDIPSKSDIKNIAKDESEKVFNKISKDTLTKKEIKDMIRQTLHAYHKFMWEKKGIWMNQI
jgi:ethanolamine ammonia-lyase small subunit